MQVSILLNTSEYRGSHSAGVKIAYNLKPDETVQQLAERLLTEMCGVIEIRKVNE